MTDTDHAEVLETKRLDMVILVCTILQLISYYQLDQLVQHIKLVPHHELFNEQAKILVNQICHFR